MKITVTGDWEMLCYVVLGQLGHLSIFSIVEGNNIVAIVLVTVFQGRRRGFWNMCIF